MAQHSSQDDNSQIFIRGPLHEAADAFAARFTASIGFDYRLAVHDIAVSIAHARMLGKIGVLDDAEQNGILAGLAKIQEAVATDSFNWQVGLEDVHMNIEHRLIEIVGEAGKKLHTGRSRNDQVATSMRLYLRSEIDALINRLAQLIQVVLSLAGENVATIMPGFTHLQVAQPITFGHHMLAWAAMLERDVERLLDCHSRLNRLPLGSAALAGTGFPIDRQFLASKLGFSALCPNSLDAVSDRDFAIEFCACASLLLMHFSRISEELILWSSAQFNFISLPDRFCTGSSIMPQKKNPDVPELVRGKSGRVFGHLMSLLTLMKAQPLAYNKDNQEDKEPVFDVVDTARDCVRALTDMLPHIELHPDRMTEAVAGFATATDLADYLVAQGVPFREAHTTVGRIVAACIDQGKTLAELSLDELQAFSPVIAKDVMTALTLEGSIASRSHAGGTAPEAVVAAIADTQTRLAGLQQRHKTICACYPAPEPPPKNPL